VDEPITDATETTERSPLNEITPNASPEHVSQVEEVPRKHLREARARKVGKKAQKPKRARLWKRSRNKQCSRMCHRLQKTLQLRK
jgi:hypothetical protein